MIPAVSAATGSGAPTTLPYLWVTAGTSGALYTSSSTTFADGTWTSRTSSFGTTNIYAVASNGTSQYVAVGDTGKLATSPDATTWTQRTSSFGTTEIRNVAYGNGYWVAVGGTGKVAHSTDGTTWTQVTTGVSGTVYSVAWGNGLWAIGGSSGTIYTATDPTGTWTSRTSTLSSIQFIHYAKSQSIWIAGTDTGTTGALASSTDGLTWTARNSAFSLFGTGSAVASNTSVIAGAFIPASLQVDIQSSTNGTTWTDRTPGVSSGIILSGTSSASDDAGLMVLPGYQTSTNGSTWSSSKNGGGGELCVCHSSGTPSLR